MRPFADRGPNGDAAPSASRILFPFLGSTISGRALDSALRLARAEDATLIPAYLAVISQRLTLDAPIPRECETAMPLLEVIEQRANREHVPIDTRIERGRSPRHGLQRLLGRERYDMLILPAKTPTSDGFDAHDIAWALDHAPGDVIVLRASRGRVQAT